MADLEEGSRATASAPAPVNAPLWLVRHAQPLVAPGTCYGALDVAADVAATRVAAQALADRLPTQALVWCSPLQRCELLAHVLYGLRPDLSYKTDARLAEMDFGAFEGLRWDHIPAHAYDNWMADFWQHRFGGIESVAMFMTRVASAWHDTQAAQAASGMPVAQVWITHAGVIRAAHLLAKGVFEVRSAALWPLDAPAFGQWQCVDLVLASGQGGLLANRFDSRIRSQALGAEGGLA